MKNLTKLPLALLAATFMMLFSCRSEDPQPENDNEVITDVTLTFQELDQSGNAVGNPLSFKASNPEGITPGSSPTIDVVTLAKGKTYTLSIALDNAIAKESITEEVKEESDAHQFYFLGSFFVGSPAPANYVYDDEGGIKLGLKGKVTVAESPSSNTANLQLILRHDLDKNYEGASNPHFTDYTKAGGESDLDITFQVTIE